MRVGTIPLSIHVVDTRAISASRGTAGKIWVALMRMPRRSDARDRRPEPAASSSDRVAALSSATGLHELMASAPAKTISSISAPSSPATGSTDSHSGMTGTTERSSQTLFGICVIL